MSSDEFEPSRPGRLLGALGAGYGTLVGLYLLVRIGGDDVFAAGFVLLAVAFALLGGYGGLRGRTAPAWIGAVGLALVAVLGAMSIAPFLGPGAVMLLGAALATQLPRRARVRAAIRDDPPGASGLLYRAGVSIAAVALGAASIYVGAVLRGLFGACAVESLACVVRQTDWPAIVLTVTGLVGIGLAGRTLVGQLVSGYHLMRLGTGD